MFASEPFFISSAFDISSVLRMHESFAYARHDVLSFLFVKAHFISVVQQFFLIRLVFHHPACLCVPQFLVLYRLKEDVDMFLMGFTCTRLSRNRWVLGDSIRRRKQFMI